MKAYHSFKEIQNDIAQGKITCVDLVKNYLSNIESNKHLNAFLEVFADEALKIASSIDDKIKNKTAGKLAGMVIGIKDNICYKDHKVGAASKILEGFTSLYSSTVVSRLVAEDAIIIGRLNCDEFAMGSSNENSAFGNVLNPLNNEMVPGGSSGGSVAAVAANLCYAAFGSDTGGSVRQPASFCGVVGLKPTYGRVSRYGLVAFASSLDQVGPLALDAQDCADLLENIAGFDPWDSTTQERAVPAFGRAVSEIRTNAVHRAEFLKNLRVGVPAEFFAHGLDSSVRNAVESAIDALKKSGAKIVPVSLPHSQYALAVYYVIAVSEASANLQRFDGVRFGPRVMPNGPQTTLEEMYEATRGELFGNEVKRRILLGTFALSSGYYDAYYKRACQVRALIARDFNQCFEKVDVLLGPTTPTIAPQKPELSI